MSQAEQDAESLGQILRVVAENKEGLMVFLDIVNDMHQAGLLEIVRGMLKGRQQIGLIGINQLNKSGAQRMIKNSMSAAQFLGQLDPAQLKNILDAVAHGLEQAHPSDKKLGMWGMMSTLRDPNVKTSVSVLMNFLRGMGEALPSATPSQ